MLTEQQNNKHNNANTSTNILFKLKTLFSPSATCFTHVPPPKPHFTDWVVKISTHQMLTGWVNIVLKLSKVFFLHITVKCTIVYTLMCVCCVLWFYRFTNATLLPKGLQKNAYTSSLKDAHTHAYLHHPQAPCQRGSLSGCLVCSCTSTFCLSLWGTHDKKSLLLVRWMALTLKKEVVEEVMGRREKWEEEIQGMKANIQKRQD